MEATEQGWNYRTYLKAASLAGALLSHHNASVAEQRAQKKTLGVLCPSKYCGVPSPTADFAAVK